MTLPKGFKPKVTREEKGKSTRDTGKENNNNTGLNDAKVTPATSDDFINKQEDNVYTLNNKGLALDSLGKHKEAIESYDKALEINANYTNALNNKGLALIDLERYKEAIESYDKALEINPNYTNALNNKGLAIQKARQLGVNI